MSTFWLYALFLLFVLAMLVLDLGVFHRRAHAITRKEALIWSIVWVSLSLSFCAGLGYYQGREKALEFLTGYLVEQSLSLDNLFVFLMIFMYFAVPDRYQHRVLFWGILGAVFMRLAFILAGAALLARFHWLIYVFGAFLVYTGIRFAQQAGVSIHPEANPVLRLLRRLLPITRDYQEEHFFARLEGRLYATPLFVVLVLVETSDVMFAVDSIPAIFAITMDTFIVFTSNIFAILGLRSMYFLLANIMPMFRYLSTGLGIILTYVGVKMLLTDFLKIPAWVSLLVIAAVLAVSLSLSVWVSRRESLEIEKEEREKAFERLREEVPAGEESQDAEKSEPSSPKA